ncbi:MAG TPA: CBS domain-containing protein [Streptosporangiaceae bacterium]|nr:CBS domain-containing protein [Streptosporangiaceae bacterium]
MSAIVKDVMTTDVVAVRKDVSFKEMAARLGQHRISAFPVVDDEGKVIGVVSEADMLTKEALVASGGMRPSPVGHLRYHKDIAKAGAMTAEDLMTTPPVTIGPEETVARAARLMYSCRVKRLPVVDAWNHLLGIVSRADVLSVYNRADADIKNEIRDGVILNKFRTDPDRYTVTVTDGIVTLEGRAETEERGQALVNAVWRVDGVVSVRGRLFYPPGPFISAAAGAGTGRPRMLRG